MLPLNYLQPDTNIDMKVYACFLYCHIKCFPLNYVLTSIDMKVYVLLAFFFVFFLFCWRRGAPNNQLGEKVAAIIIFCL